MDDRDPEAPLTEEEIAFFTSPSHASTYDCLRDVVMQRALWPYPGDHTHCDFCDREISDDSCEDSTPTGYRDVGTSAGVGMWVCERCFHSLRGPFGWVQVSETARSVGDEDLLAMVAVRDWILGTMHLATMRWSSLTGHLAAMLACRAFGYLRMLSSGGVVQALEPEDGDEAQGKDAEQLPLTNPLSEEKRALLLRRGIQVKGVRNRPRTSMVERTPYATMVVVHFDQRWVVTEAWRLPAVTVEYLLVENADRDGKHGRKLRIRALREHAARADAAMKGAYPIEDLRDPMRERLPGRFADLVKPLPDLN